VLGGAEDVGEEYAAVVAVCDVVPRQLLVLSPQMDKGRVEKGLSKGPAGRFDRGWILPD
jgi:hypothetical protein